MDENLARIIIAGVIGLTISISMVSMAIAKMVASRRRKDLPESTVSRLEERLERMELAIDAMATEVERVAEGVGSRRQRAERSPYLVGRVLLNERHVALDLIHAPFMRKLEQSAGARAHGRELRG